ncbi:MAG: DUF4180 domain-containing protein [Ignavibacteriaceae bacterium]
MKIILHESPGKNKLAEIISGEIIINNVQDALDLMADVNYQGSDTIIIYEKNINPEFFNLHSGFLGEVLQKFANYGVRMVILGDFSKYNSNSLNAFIIECNRGKQFLFAGSIEEAKEKL